jgi:hypothetical protein
MPRALLPGPAEGATSRFAAAFMRQARDSV